MSHLRREIAPFSDEVWAEIDATATTVLKLHLAGRKLVDFSGPHGLKASTVDLGWTRQLAAPPAAGVSGHLRLAQPLVELRAPFRLAMADVRAIERGAKDADLDPVVDAAKAIARAEDHAIFHGYAEAGIKGIVEASPHDKVTLKTDYLKYPDSVLAALDRLRDAGVIGPYAIALGPRCHAGLLRTTSTAGYPILEHVKRLIDGPIVWAPAVDGAVVMSLRGGDFELTVGQDLSIGYRDHTAEHIDLYIEESLTFRTLGPEAAVPLVYGAK